MIISKIEIWNFQSHLHTQLDLAEFTAFVGPSNAGKTVVERVLSWVFYNDWDQSYPQNVDLATVAELTLEDGTRIRRIRHGDKNTAKIARPGEDVDDVDTLRDFGDEIPGVFDLINVRPLRVGSLKLDLNFSRQDPEGQSKLFLIGESKPAKAQLLGRLYGAHVINAMLRLMSKDKLDASKRAKAAQAEADQAKLLLKDYADLPAQLAALACAEQKLVNLKDLESVHNRIIAVYDTEREIKPRSWLLGVNLGLVKASVNELGQLRILDQAIAAVRAKIQALAPRRWLSDYDLKAFTAKVRSLDECYKLRRRVQDLDRQRDPKAARWWLVEVDVNTTAVKLADLAALYKLREQVKLSEIHSSGLERLGVIAGADLAGIRARVAEMQFLSDSRRRLQSLLLQQPQLTLEKSELERKIASAIEGYAGELFEGGECPMCGTEHPQLDATEARKRLFALRRIIA